MTPTRRRAGSVSCGSVYKREALPGIEWPLVPNVGTGETVNWLRTVVNREWTVSATTELFDRWKAAKGHKTDTSAADALGLSKQAVNNWRTRDGNGEADAIEKMCRDLNEDPVKVILQAYSEAAKHAESRRTLERLARRFGAVVLALGMMAGATDTSAKPAGFSGKFYTLCEVLATLAAWLGLRGPFGSWTPTPWTHRPASPLWA